MKLLFKIFLGLSWLLISTHSTAVANIKVLGPQQSFRKATFGNESALSEQRTFSGTLTDAQKAPAEMDIEECEEDSDESLSVLLNDKLGNYFANFYARLFGFLSEGNTESRLPFSEHFSSNASSRHLFLCVIRI